MDRGGLKLVYCWCSEYFFVPFGCPVCTVSLFERQAGLEFIIVCISIGHRVVIFKMEETQ